MLSRDEIISVPEIPSVKSSWCPRTFALANLDRVPHRAIRERLEIAVEVRSKA